MGGYKPVKSRITNYICLQYEKKFFSYTGHTIERGKKGHVIEKVHRKKALTKQIEQIDYNRCV